MNRMTIAAALLLLPVAASAQQAAPAAPPPAAAEPAASAEPAGKDVYDMPCTLFHANADGSWNATKAMTLQPAAGPIALKPNFKFKPGTLFAGFDLAAALDKSCKH
ncbi:MAG: hypothetical protein ACRYGP_22320 [Janthinobacterium lividum]